MDNGSKSQLLGMVELFGDLSATALEGVSTISRHAVFSAGSTIFRQGDDADSMYIIEQGSVRLVSEGGETQLGPGSAFGTMALLRESPRHDSAFAEKPCELLIIDKDAFNDLLYLHKEVAYEVLWNAVHQLSRQA